MNFAIPLMFWTSVAIVAYVFVGYPIALTAWGALRPRPWQKEPLEPSISIVMAAHNETAWLTSKIRNLLSLDYPQGRIDILIGSDGSTDGTAEQLLAITDPPVRVFIFPERKGKPSVLNALVPKAHGEIVVLSDVRQTFDRQVLRWLSQSFADPNVGAVSGELIMTRGGTLTAVAEGSGFYWRYEKFVRSRECIIDSTLVSGAIYAIRKALFEPIPEDTLVDDLLIALRISHRGYRVVFERDAHAYEGSPDTSAPEFTRKVRTLAGVFQLFARERWLLIQQRNRLWWQTTSHKALRMLVAPLQCVALSGNLALARESTFSRITLLAQLFFYAAAIAGWLLPQSWKKPLAITFPYIFCLLSWATVIAFVRWIRGRQTVTWDKASSSFATTGVSN